MPLQSWPETVPRSFRTEPRLDSFDSRFDKSRQKLTGLTELFDRIDRRIDRIDSMIDSNSVTRRG